MKITVLIPTWMNVSCAPESLYCEFTFSLEDKPALNMTYRSKYVEKDIENIISSAVTRFLRLDASRKVLPPNRDRVAFPDVPLPTPEETKALRDQLEGAVRREVTMETLEPEDA